MISRILLITLEWLAISGATIAAAVAVQDGPAWTMVAACLCALIGAQLRALATRRAMTRHTDAMLGTLRGVSHGARRSGGR